jgi:hypothetical protein
MDGRGGVSSPDVPVQSRWRWLWALWECVSAHALPASGSLVYQRPMPGAPDGRVGLRGVWKRDSGCGPPAMSAPSRRRAAQRHFTASRLRARACYGSTISKPCAASAARSELSAGRRARCWHWLWASWECTPALVPPRAGSSFHTRPVSGVSRDCAWFQAS